MIPCAAGICCGPGVGVHRNYALAFQVLEMRGSKHRICALSAQELYPVRAGAVFLTFLSSVLPRGEDKLATALAVTCNDAFAATGYGGAWDSICDQCFSPDR